MMRSMMVVVGTLLVSTGASAQVGVSIQGRAGARIQERVIERLDQAGVQAVAADSDDPEEVSRGRSGGVVGTITRRGGRWRGALGVFDGSGELVERVRAVGRNDRALANALARRLAPVLENLGTSEAAAAVEMDPRRVVVGHIQGPGSARVRSQIQRVLESEDPITLVERSDLEAAANRLSVDITSDDGLRAAAGSLGVHALVEGETQRRGRRWTAVVEVVDASTAEVVGEHRFVANNAARLSNKVRSELWSRLGRAFAETEAPPAPESAAQEDVVARDRDDDDDDVPEPATVSGDRPMALEIAAEGRVFSRKLRYKDDRYSLLRGYTLDFGPAIAFTVRWFPGAHATNNWLAHIGLDLEYERAFGIDTTRRDGEIFPTTMQSWAFGLRGRIPIGAQSVGVALAYGGHDFVVDPSGPAEPGRNNIPLLPSVSYKFVRLSADGRIAPVAGLRILAGFSYKIVLDAGGINSDIWFPRLSVGGIDVYGGLGYELEVGVEIRAMVLLRRYFYSFTPEPTDPWIAGGAVDQYLSYTLGLAWRL